jgi:cold shock CspA family protein
MPSGTVAWFDPRSGEGYIRHLHREYPVSAREMEPRARVTGARVHFDVKRDGGLLRAVNVRALAGTRSSPRQRRMGDLAGAKQPADKGNDPLTRRSSDRGWKLAGRPTKVVREWVRTLAAPNADEALPFYAPDAVVHVGGKALTGRNRVREFLYDSRLIGRGMPEPDIRGESNEIVLVRWPALPGAPPRQARLRIAHGRIAEQWGPES